MSHFAFLQSEWPTLQEEACKAEYSAHSDPRTACFYARRCLELTVKWLYKHDASLTVPYQDNLSALVHEPSFHNTVGQVIFDKARIIVKLGNLAVHEQKPVGREAALTALRELFHVCYWLARTYARNERPAPGLAFDPSKIPQAVSQPQTVEQVKKLLAVLQGQDRKVAELEHVNASLDQELQKLKAEIAAAKKANTTQPDVHDYSGYVPEGVELGIKISAALGS
jgi:type I restriction enzyme R subunit